MAPVFKKGEKYNAANYRPVSLTSICCKTLEHIIVSNINKHLAFESILAACQHGIRSQRSWETQLVQFYHDLVSNLDHALNSNQKQTDVVIMDFAKAFDKVPHRRLLYKLEYYGIRGSTHKWINSWLSERFHKVVLVAKPQIQSRSYLVSPKDWCWDRSYFSFLAHLSRRLTGELIVYKGIRRPSSVVRPSSVNIFKRHLL